MSWNPWPDAGTGVDDGTGFGNTWEPMDTSSGFSTPWGGYDTHDGMEVDPALLWQPETQNLPPAPAEAQGMPPAPARVIAGGCSNMAVSHLVEGAFVLVSNNHGRPVYRKEQQAECGDIVLYFWDDRDGPNFCGWYFGREVGGDQVIAHHMDRESPLPPSAGWRGPGLLCLRADKFQQLWWSMWHIRFSQS